MKLQLKNWILAILSSLLMWAAWPPNQLGWLGFIGFVPLLILADNNKNKTLGSSQFRLLIYLALLIWNILTTWWIWAASPGGSIAAIVLNTLMMSIVWWLYAGVNNKSGTAIGFIFLVSFWITYEFFHLNWDGTWPWLILGNAFANNIALIQWYELTGHLGGSIWIMLVNILIFQCYKTMYSKPKFKRNIIATFTLILTPIVLSLAILGIRIPQTETIDKRSKVNTLIIQPNLDPYSEKFNNDGNSISPYAQLERMIAMAEEKITDEIEFVILPETALQGQMNDNALQHEIMIQRIKSFVNHHPNCCVITGANTYASNSTKFSETSRQLEEGGKYYEFYNTALKIDTSSKIEIYHKSRLVPGVEKLPYPIIFGPLVRLLDLEAQAGGLGIQNEASVFTHHNFKIAPLICYESVFGGYGKDFAAKGADVFVVITNDGWWGNTDGYKQHLDYGKLRAIEFRRDLVQCANTGISAIINAQGLIVKESNWWKQEVLTVNFVPQNTITFYAQFGDYIGWLGVFISLSIVIWISLNWFYLKNKSTKNEI